MVEPEAGQPDLDTQVGTLPPATVAEESVAVDEPERASEVAIDGLRASHLAVWLEAAQVDDPSLGTLITPARALEAHACASDAVVAAIGHLRVGELIDPRELVLDADQMTSAERETIAKAVSTCVSESDVEAMVAVSDRLVAPCLADRLLSTGQIVSMLDQLLEGVDVEQTSAVTGFRFSCENVVFDELFGSHDTATARMLQVWSRAIADWMFEGIEMSTLEHSCVVRGAMSAVGVDWVRGYEAIAPADRPHPIDHLFISTPEGERNRILDGITSAYAVCTDALSIAMQTVDQSTVTPAQVGCLRDVLTQADLHLLGQLTFGIEITPAEAAQLQNAFGPCEITVPTTFG